MEPPAAGGSSKDEGAEITRSGSVVVKEGEEIEKRGALTRSWSRGGMEGYRSSPREPAEKGTRRPSNFGVFSIQGKRKTNEDSHKIVPYNCIPNNPENEAKKEEKEGGHLNPPSSDRDRSLSSASSPRSPRSEPPQQCTGFFGVFDGHGGEKCSEFVADRLSDTLFAQSVFGKNMDQAFKDAFLEVEESWKTYVEKEQVDGGTTALVACFMENDLFVANVGDSEGVLCRSGKAVAVSTPHNMKKNVAEKERVEKEGGRVFRERIGHPALNPRFFSIAVTRAIGDLLYKDAKICQNKPSGLIAIPEIQKIHLQREDQFLILACDGLWDVVTYQEAVDFVLKEIGTEKMESMDLCATSEALAKHAFDKGSTDNITVLLVTM